MISRKYSDLSLLRGTLDPFGLHCAHGEKLSFPIQLGNILWPTVSSPYVQGQQQPYSTPGLLPQLSRERCCIRACNISMTSLSTSPAANLLAHDDVQLVLHLSMDTGCDGGRQLLRGALEGADELPELVQQRVPHLLLSHLLVLQVSLQLLDICNKHRRRFVPSVAVEMIRAEIQLPGSMCSPAEAIAEPVYEHRSEEMHKPWLGLHYIKLETHFPVSPSHRTTQHSNKPTILLQQTSTGTPCSGEIKIGGFFISYVV